MYYVISKNVKDERLYPDLIKYLVDNKLEYEVVPWIPFGGAVEPSTGRKDVWFFGNIDYGIYLQKKEWYPGVMYNEGFNSQFQLAEYQENMLNSDGRIQQFGHLIGEEENYANRNGLFIRPTKDTKLFNAKGYTGKEWNEYVDETIQSGTFLDIGKTTKMLVAPLKNIQQEIRCWIVDGEPVTMSQYRIGSRINMMNMDRNEEVYIFSKKMAKLFSPARVFVMDICLYNDDYKIVEINCANMSGFYDMDISKLIQSLEKAFGNG